MQGKKTIIVTNFLILCMLISLGGFMFVQPTATSVSVTSNTDLYFNGNTQNRNVTLMINVYWGTEYIDEMLAALKEYNVSTTFFVGGIWVKKYPEVLQKISQAGHEIGNHGYTHKQHSKLNYQANQEEILQTHNMVKQILKVDMNLFAPPSGDYGDDTIQGASALGYKTIMWTRDTIDWRDQDENLIYNRATKNMANGDFVLMHPTESTAKTMPRILEYCKNNNYKVVTVSENLK